jgi:hypothetical protein
MILGISQKKITEIIDVYKYNNSHSRGSLRIVNRSHNKGKIDSLDVGFVGLASSKSTR